VETASFEDGIGRRRQTTDANGTEVETLVLRRELSEAECAEAALVQRAGQLAGFSHPAFSPVLRVERLSSAMGGLAIVSGAPNGIRLSDVLGDAQRKRIAPDFDAARSVIGQTAVALADFHRQSRDMSHGAIGPERVVLRPDGRAVIMEPILAPVLQQLQMARTPLWTEFRVPVPPLAGTARFDQMTDVMQLGVFALALLLGRPIRCDEYPNRLHDLLMEASSADVLAERRPVSQALRTWVHRALQMEPRSSFRTAADAVSGFEAVLAEEPRHKASPASVVSYLAACSSGADGGWKGPAILAAPPGTSNVPTKAAADTAAPGSQAEAATDGSGPGRAAAARQPARLSHPPAASPRRQRSRLRGDATHRSPGLERRLDWALVRKGARISAISFGLVALFGVTYLGARGYLSLSGFTAGRGTLVVDSRPAGVDVFVDGVASGKTPATLELRAGEHTLVLRTSRGITLVPVVVVAGARRVELVDVRPGQVAPKAPKAPVSNARPPQPPSRNDSTRPELGAAGRNPLD
jgi:hypothetical protein